VEREFLLVMPVGWRAIEVTPQGWLQAGDFHCRVAGFLAAVRREMERLDFGLAF